MSVLDPRDLNPSFAAACNARDLGALLQLYEPDACTVTGAGELLQGHAAIEASLRSLLALGGTLKSATVSCVINGDLALVNAEWSLVDGHSPSGEPVAIAGRSAEVICRQADGSWKLRIDNPFALVK